MGDSWFFKKALLFLKWEHLENKSIFLICKEDMLDFYCACIFFRSCVNKKWKFQHRVEKSILAQLYISEIYWKSVIKKVMFLDQQSMSLSQSSPHYLEVFFCFLSTRPATFTFHTCPREGDHSWPLQWKSKNNFYLWTSTPM